MQCLDTMLVATRSVKIMYNIFWICPTNSLTELSTLLNRLSFVEIPTNKNQHVKFEANVKQLLLIKISMAFGSTATIQVSKMQIRSFTKNQSLCGTQLNDMYFNVVSWNLGFSEIQVHYNYKQKDLVYNGHVLPCSYKNENCQPTAHFPSWTFLFQIELCFVSFSYQLEAKTTQSKNRFRIESLPVGQNTENMPACHSLFNKNPGLPIYKF